AFRRTNALAIDSCDVRPLYGAFRRTDEWPADECDEKHPQTAPPTLYRHEVRVAATPHTGVRDRSSTADRSLRRRQAKRHRALPHADGGRRGDRLRAGGGGGHAH